MILEDRQLLRDYAEKRDESAFAELVRRHVDLVYSAALRESKGDTATAEDISQSVFTELARKSSSLTSHPALAGWLYTCVRQMSANVRRAHERRQRREQEAHTMNALASSDPSEADWQRIQPLLDDAMHALSESDRTAVVLRYFKDRSHREVGEALGVNESAARKRVDRAVEKLRELLANRGVTIGASGLTVLITANAVQAAPAGLALTISTTAALGTVAVATTTKIIAITTMQKIVVSTALAVAIGAGVYQTYEVSKWRGKAVDLQNQQAGQLSQLQTERDDLAAKLAALGAANDQAQSNTIELAKLRNEVARLRANQPKPAVASERTPKPTPPNARPATPPAPSQILKEEWSDRGFGSPQDALRTRGWAIVNGERERFKESLYITDSARKTLEDMFIKMAEASKDPNKAQFLQQALDQKLGVEEGILMPLMAQNEAFGFTGYRVLSQDVRSADEMTLKVQTSSAKSHAQTETMKFQRIGDDWKVVIDDDFVKRATGGR